MKWELIAFLFSVGFLSLIWVVELNHGSNDDIRIIHTLGATSPNISTDQQSPAFRDTLTQFFFIDLRNILQENSKGRMNITPEKTLGNYHDYPINSTVSNFSVDFEVIQLSDVVATVTTSTTDLIVRQEQKEANSLRLMRVSDANTVSIFDIAMRTLGAEREMNHHAYFFPSFAFAVDCHPDVDICPRSEIDSRNHIQNWNHKPLGKGSALRELPFKGSKEMKSKYPLLQYEWHHQEKKGTVNPIRHSKFHKFIRNKKGKIKGGKSLSNSKRVSSKEGRRKSKKKKKKKGIKRFHETKKVKKIRKDGWLRSGHLYVFYYKQKQKFSRFPTSRPTMKSFPSVLDPTAVFPLPTFDPSPSPSLQSSTLATLVPSMTTTKRTIPPADSTRTVSPSTDIPVSNKPTSRIPTSIPTVETFPTNLPTTKVTTSSKIPTSIPTVETFPTNLPTTKVTTSSSRQSQSPITLTQSSIPTKTPTIVQTQTGKPFENPTIEPSNTPTTMPMTQTSIPTKTASFSPISTTVPTLLSATEIPTIEPTEIEVPGLRFTIEYFTADLTEPTTEQFDQVEQRTVEYLEAYLRQNFQLNPLSTIDTYSGNAIGNEINPLQISYNINLQFTLDSTIVPTEADLMVLIESAFLSPAVQNYIDMLQEVDSTNPFLTTSSVVYKSDISTKMFTSASTNSVATLTSKTRTGFVIASDQTPLMVLKTQFSLKFQIDGTRDMGDSNTQIQMKVDSLTDATQKYVESYLRQQFMLTYNKIIVNFFWSASDASNLSSLSMDNTSYPVSFALLFSLAIEVIDGDSLQITTLTKDGLDGLLKSAFTEPSVLFFRKSIEIILV